MLHPSGTAFASAGGSGRIDIDTARECEWNASSDSRWITLKPVSGQGTGTIQFSIVSNDQAARRAAVVRVNDQQISLSQDAAPCRVQLTHARDTLGFDGGDDAISVATLSGCRWTATTTATWIQLREPVSGTGNGDVRFHIAANDGAQRTGAIRVAESQQTIVQQASPGPSNAPSPVPAPPAPSPSPSPSPSPTPPAPSPTPQPPAPTPSCTLELDPASADAGPTGDDGRVSVRTQSSCSWTASSQSDWLTITSAASGKGNGAVTYRVATNSNQQSRSGSIAFAGKSFTVRQAAAPPPAPTPPSCSFRVDPDSEKFDAHGGDQHVHVRTTDACAWTATSPTSWIQITSGAAGRGDGEVRYRVAPNDGAAREGTLNVADRTVGVEQEGAKLREVKLKGKVDDVQGGCPSVTFTVDGRTVQANGDTKYEDGSCRSLRKDVKVEVKGVQLSNGGAVTATEIKINDKGDDGDGS